MPDETLPLVLSMVICHEVRQNPDADAVYIIGESHTLGVEHLPCHVPMLAVYLQLGDASRSFTAHVVCVRTRDDEPIFASRDHILQFRSRLEVVRAVFTIRDCPFPEAGEYSMQLWLNGAFVTERRFHVVRIAKEDE